MASRMEGGELASMQELGHGTSAASSKRKSHVLEQYGTAAV